MKLEFELIPKTCWYSNIRSEVSQEDWDKLRKATYKKYNHCCGICGDKSKLSAHEIWNFIDEASIQELVGLIALCENCHHIKHIGFAGVLASQGKIDMNEIIQHYCEVNECDEDIFYQEKSKAMKLWAERSKKQWTLDITFLCNLEDRIEEIKTTN